MSSETELYSSAVTILILMVIAMNLGSAMHHLKIRYIGETGLYMIIGLVVGTTVAYIFKRDQAIVKDIQLNPSFFYMVLLPPIIFEAGFNLQRKNFFKNITTILLLAFVGGLTSTIVTSVSMYLLTELLPINFSMHESLLFGSLISSTDPVTVLSMLPDNIDRRLYVLIFGESALNDAVAMILYRFFADLAEQGNNPSFSAFMVSVATSFGVFLGSILVGLVLGLAFAKLTKHVKAPDAPIFEVCSLLVFAYLSYLLAEVLSMAGIISVLFCGITMAHYSISNLSEISLLSIKILLRAFSTTMETFIFLYVGLGLAAFGSPTVVYNIPVICMAFISIAISRTQVFLSCGIANLLKVNGPHDFIPFKHQIFLWFAGLRGAVSFALALGLLEFEYFPEEIRKIIFGTTLIIVFASILFCGATTPFMLRILGLAGKQSGAGGHGEDGHGKSGEGREDTIVEENEDENDDDDDDDENNLVDPNLDVAQNVSSRWAKIHAFDRKYDGGINYFGEYLLRDLNVLHLVLRYIRPWFSNVQQRHHVLGPDADNIRAVPELKGSSRSASRTTSRNASRKGSISSLAFKSFHDLGDTPANLKGDSRRESAATSPTSAKVGGSPGAGKGLLTSVSGSKLVTSSPLRGEVLKTSDTAMDNSSEVGSAESSTEDLAMVKMEAKLDAASNPFGEDQ